MNQKQIKIFVDAHCYDQQREGTHTFIHGIYSVLLKDHPDLDIYFGVHNIRNFRDAFPAIKDDHILRYPKSSKGFFRLYSIIPYYIKKHNFDFCHFQYVAPLSIGSSKYIVTLHDALFNDFSSGLSFVYRFSRNYFFKKSFKKADIKTTVSFYSKQQISRIYGIPEEKINVVPSGVSNVVNTNSNRQESVQRINKQYGLSDFILYVSRIEPRKNHLFLLEAYLELELYKKNIPLVFIGKESIAVPGLNDKIQSLPEEQKKYFHWFKYTETTTLSDFYLACKVFVYPSLAEGFGVPPLEAAALNRPVLCSSATAMKDFSFFEPNTFNPIDKVELKQKLQQIINHPPLQETLDSIANEVRSHYDWKKNAEKFYSLLKSNT